MGMTVPRAQKLTQTPNKMTGLLESWGDSVASLVKGCTCLQGEGPPKLVMHAQAVESPAGCRSPREGVGVHQLENLQQ